MSELELQEFAQILISEVRDAAIKSADTRLNHQAFNPSASALKAAEKEVHIEDLLKRIIPDIVDETIFSLLNAIDQGLLPMSFKASNGNLIDLAAKGHGELGGWYAGSGDGAWIPKYSNERHVDEFADLKDFFEDG
ncbi:MAG: hypothetical protein F9K24_18090 [Leptonema illini]|jgi:hypothetical protein|uniref:Uncharacterized protein n=1 Tax=Leptonema illini TaxID=183 RepID=A0A833LZV1_9LEPT|nr:MAG: hypothetical protein F9K24_18090 [Leptonema illini]